MNRATVPGGAIGDDDLALVRQQPSTSRSDVVALIDGEATIKKFVKGPYYAVLKPVSSKAGHHSILIKPGFQVQGIVQGMWKKGSDLLPIEDEDQ